MATKRKTSAKQQDEASPTAEFTARMNEAYASDDPTVSLGKAIVADTVVPEVTVQVPIAMTNRHGLIAGATGTGKTVTVQVLAEKLVDAGVAVFAADMKGDLSGLAEAGAANEKIDERVASLGIEWKPAAQDPVFWALGGLGAGIPVRATVGSFGPQLLAKVLGSNETQRSSLSLVFAFAEKKQLPLVELADLRAVLQFLTSDLGKPELEDLGGVSSQTAGVLLRAITELEQQGADALFGAPELDIDHLVSGGRLHLLELPGVQDRPKLFSTFLMWLLASLFESLPEVGDLDKPKLVFFFDEAHLLFADASKDFVEQVAQTVRLIRSKGVGVYFITQLPDDVPGPVLAQLGNRIQHALRAHTPRDAKALRAAVTTYPKTDDYDLEEDLTRLGVGEAMVTFLDEKGAPTPVIWTRLEPPASKIGDIGREQVEAAAKSDELWGAYAERTETESAKEKVEAAVAKAEAASDDATKNGGFDVKVPEPSGGKRRSSRRRAPKQQEDEPGVVEEVLRSREGRSMINTVLRGIFGIFKKG